MIDKLKQKYKELQWIQADSNRFHKYGELLLPDETVHEALLQLKEYMLNETEIPHEGNVYVAGDPSMEALSIHDYFVQRFGGIQVQSGYCNGKNQQLGALEYHKSPELIYAVTSCILLLGHPDDLETSVDDRGKPRKHFDSANCIGLYLEEGQFIELHPGILHFAPIRVNSEGFKTAIILPASTNTNVSKGNERHSMLFKKNKWLIAHEDRKDLLNQGAYHGLYGKNYFIDLP